MISARAGYCATDFISVNFINSGNTSKPSVNKQGRYCIYYDIGCINTGL